jgi:tetratricopeptide (TPR) repeat protein
MRRKSDPIPPTTSQLASAKSAPDAVREGGEAAVREGGGAGDGSPGKSPSVGFNGPTRRYRWVAATVAASILLAGGMVFADWWSALPDDAAATYVGRSTCAECHAQQHALWQGSDHDLAMDRATDDTVLGDFNNASLEHFGITSRMFRRDGKFMVHTEGPDGRMADFEVKYVFGVRPLQQYMVEFDRPEGMPENEIARLQVLRLSWDTAAERWFYLSPPDVAEKLSPDDDLHWTGIAQRWNTMCAECHSTNLQKGFDPETQTYHTTFSEIDVSCETCHGPGSLHVKLARGRSLFWDRKRGYGLPDLKSKNSDVEISSCAPCHSRRRPLHPDYRPGEDYYDYFASELLNEGTYHADGQILDEVYVHGSFLQSKMYHKGIRCSDCHDPHSTRLKHSGNQVCTSCHTHSAGKYDTPAHHQHKPDSTGASCVNCHMPSSTYMMVDPRRDHSLRIPRPDLSVELGTPNACTGCHLRDNPLGIGGHDKLVTYADWLNARRQGDTQVGEDLARLDQWAADATSRWYPNRPQADPHYALALDAGRRGADDAQQRLMALARDLKYPAIARATAASQLGQFENHDSLKAARAAIGDPHPLVRAAAIQRLQTQPIDELLDDLLPLLEDPVRLVRAEAARALARVPDTEIRSADRDRLKAALDEYIAGLMLNNDRAGAHLMLGNVLEERGDVEGAVQAYRTAIRTEPRATGPRTNLAALWDRQAEQARTRAEQATQRQDTPMEAKARAEAQQYSERAAELRRQELPLLARDAGLAPDSGAIQYRYGLALYLDGQPAEAEVALRRAAELEPEVPDFVLALALFYQKQGRMDEALNAAQRLLVLRPREPGYQQLLHELRQATGN